MRWRTINRAAALIGALLASPLMAPQLLAFPHSATIGAHRVYAEAPINDALPGIVAAADTLARRSPLSSSRRLDQPIFLTDGGWRWHWLAVGQTDAFAVSRPPFETVVVNRTDQDGDLVANPRSLARLRRLHDTLAHEFAHGLIRANFGFWRSRSFPRWLVEGYCDHVAGSSSLTDAQAKMLLARGENPPSLLYWRGRKRVEALLSANGGSVETLFGASGA